MTRIKTRTDARAPDEMIRILRKLLTPAELAVFTTGTDAELVAILRRLGECASPAEFQVLQAGMRAMGAVVAEFVFEWDDRSYQEED